MTGARGDALEWALALARAPGERLALRQRPLAEGIEPLLQIAAGNRGDALQDALARSGESEPELVEAVRFYLREVLFHAGADAYRMLGLSRAASAEQIKHHHRLLQLWLHPDRQTSDWDAIFAGRVNAAWNALRTQERRADYDAAHPVVIEAAPADHWVVPRVVADAPYVEEAAAARWRRRAPVLALFAACGVLGVVALRDALREPEVGYRAEAAQARAAASGDTDLLALQLPASRESSTTAPKARPREDTRRPSLRRPPPTPHAAAQVGKVPMPTPAVPAGADARPPTVASVPSPPPRALASASASPPVANEAMPTHASRVARTPPEAPAHAVRIAPDPLPPAPVQVAPVASPPSAVASAERVRQAQNTGRQLMAFLSARDGRIPPIWDSLAAQQRATRLRDSLHARGDTRAGDTQWRVEPADAALQAAFGDDAQVRAQLVWREQRWLVSGVALEQQP